MRRMCLLIFLDLVFGCKASVLSTNLIKINHCTFFYSLHALAILKRCARKTRESYQFCIQLENFKPISMLCTFSSVEFVDKWFLNCSCVKWWLFFLFEWYITAKRVKIGKNNDGRKKCFKRCLMNVRTLKIGYRYITTRRIHFEIHWKRWEFEMIFFGEFPFEISDGFYLTLFDLRLVISFTFKQRRMIYFLM